jgi:hypothetical protein
MTFDDLYFSEATAEDHNFLVLCFFSSTQLSTRQVAHHPAAPMLTARDVQDKIQDIVADLLRAQGTARAHVHSLEIVPPARPTPERQLTPGRGPPRTLPNPTRGGGTGPPTTSAHTLGARANHPPTQTTQPARARGRKKGTQALRQHGHRPEHPGGNALRRGAAGAPLAPLAPSSARPLGVRPIAPRHGVLHVLIV